MLRTLKYLTLMTILSGLAPAYAQLKYVQPSAQTGNSAAVIVDNVPLVHTAQVFPFNAEGKLTDSDLATQTDQIFLNASKILKQANADWRGIIKLNVHLGDEKRLTEVEGLLAQKFPGKNKPAISYFTHKLWNGAGIAIDFVAVAKSGTKTVSYVKAGIAYPSANAQAAILPAGGITYVSGQAVKGDITRGAHGTLQQLDATLKHLGMTKKDVVQIKAYMNSTGDIGIVQKELADYFADTIPPVVYVEWTSKEYEIEIELIAASPAATTKKDTAITFLDLPGMAHSPVYSKVAQVNHGKKIYFSGLYGAGTTAAAQVEDIFATLKNLLAETGSNFTHLVKATYLHNDNAGSTALAITRPKFYDPNGAPAATKAQLKAMPEGKFVCVDMIGLVK